MPQPARWPGARPRSHVIPLPCASHRVLASSLEHATDRQFLLEHRPVALFESEEVSLCLRVPLLDLVSVRLVGQRRLSPSALRRVTHLALQRPLNRGLLSLRLLDPSAAMTPSPVLRSTRPGAPRLPERSERWVAPTS